MSKVAQSFFAARTRVHHALRDIVINSARSDSKLAIGQWLRMSWIVWALFSAAALFPLASIARAGVGSLDLAPTPPMGWANWNSLGCNYNEDTIRAIADRMVSSGMREVGYRYLVIQECIMPFGHRSADGTLLPDPVKFPHWIPALVDYIHHKGLKAGIYTDLGPKTCARYEGSFQHEQQDARTFASWGIDLIEEDCC